MSAPRKRTGERFTVRKQSSGYTFSETFYVYDRQRHGRVSAEALSKQQAQVSAADLNESIGWRDES